MNATSKRDADKLERCTEKLRREIDYHNRSPEKAFDEIQIGYLALASGESSFAVRAPTEYARTAMWLIEQFLPLRFETLEMDGKVLVRVASRRREPTRPT